MSNPTSKTEVDDVQWKDGVPYVRGLMLNYDELAAYAFRLREFKASAAETSGDCWRCFHCDEVFTDLEKAREHFGNTLLTPAHCQDNDDREQLLRRTRIAVNDAIRMSTQLGQERTENEALASQLSAWEHRFPGCRTPQDVFNKYDSMEGRALAAEERLAQKTTAVMGDPDAS